MVTYIFCPESEYNLCKVPFYGPSMTEVSVKSRVSQDTMRQIISFSSLIDLKLT